jgi:uncharacterized membrane protein
MDRLLFAQEQKLTEAEQIKSSKIPIEMGKTGRIFVDAIPASALIRIKNIDQSFQQGIEVESGEYHLVVSLEGYETQEKWIIVGPGVEKRINFELAKLPQVVGRLFVEVFPEDAIIKILNIKPKYFQGMELDPGKYHLEVAAKGYAPQDRWIVLNSGDKTIRFELAKSPSIPQIGRLYVKTLPSNARIRFLNRDQRYQQGIELDPGKYYLEVAAKGYEPQKRSIVLNSGDNTVKFELVKIPPQIGRLYVKTFPSNARIRFLNSDQRFQQGIELDPGKYHLEVAANGYKPQDRWIALNTGDNSVEFKLVKIPLQIGRLYVKTAPANAQIRFLNYKRSFKQGMVLKPGKYHLEVAANGYVTEKRWVELGAKDYTFKFSLKPAVINPNIIKKYPIIKIPVKKYPVQEKSESPKTLKMK